MSRMRRVTRKTIEKTGSDGRWAGSRAAWQPVCARAGRRLLRGAPLLLAGLVALGCGSEPDTSVAPAGEPAAQEAERLDIPERWIHFENGVWIPVIDELGEHLEAAVLARADGNDHEAAIQFRLAAERLDERAPRTEAGERQRSTAADTLRNVADDLEHGATVQDHRFQQAVRRAYRESLTTRWQVVPESEWFYFVGSPDEHLSRGEALLQDHQPEPAQDEILKASVLISLEATRGEGPGLQGLTSGVAALEDLLLQIREDAPPDASARHLLYATVDHALAAHHVQQAREAASVHESRRTGHELVAAVDELDRAADWLRQNRTVGLDETMRKARDAAGQLAESTAASATRVAAAVAAVDAEATALGKRIADAGETAIPPTG